MTELTQERLKYLLDYEPETGIFRWRVSAPSRPKPGKRAGCLKETECGTYRVIRVDDRLYRSARLAWFYVHGRWPVGDTDHRDTDKLNDAIGNLREATRSQNNINGPAHAHSELGIRGVGIDKERGKYRAQIMKNGKNHMLGRFDTLEEARAARNRAVVDMYGEFARLS